MVTFKCYSGDMSFANKIIAGKGHLIHKIRGKDAATGRPAYYFVLVEPPREAAFMEALKSDSILLTDYGKIIASCWGEEPDEDTKKLLKDNYGFEA